jgi:hypothetical protein
VGVPSNKLLATYLEVDAKLKRDAPSMPLTGSLQRSQCNNVSHISQELHEFMDDLFNKEHDKPVTMLNLLNFFPGGGNNSTFNTVRWAACDTKWRSL